MRGGRRCNTAFAGQLSSTSDFGAHAMSELGSTRDSFIVQLQLWQRSVIQSLRDGMLNGRLKTGDVT
jgi:hypothetical protein